MPNATLRSTATIGSTQNKQFERADVTYDSTYSLATGSVVGTEITFVTLPTSARIHGQSFMMNDALGVGATLNLGFKPRNAQFTAAPTALSSAVAVAAASTARVPVIADHANNGKLIWELMGLSGDPGGFCDVVGTTAGATTGATGDVTLCLVAHHG